MEILPTEDARWIHQAVRRWPPEDFLKEGTTVDTLIPPGYESYGKLLHPFETDVEAPDTLAPNKEYGSEISINLTRSPGGEITITKKAADGTIENLQEEMHRRKEERRRQKLVPTTWRSVAEKYGLTFHAEISTGSYAALFKQTGWPCNLLFPGEGFLPRPLLLELLSVLQRYTPHDEVYIYQWPPHAIFKDGRTADLVRCRFAEVTAYFEEDFIGYLYAGDRSWLVHTNTDFHFTLVGGSKALLEALKSSALEVVECSGTTRVDDYSDRVNVPPPQRSATPPLHQVLRPSKVGQERMVPKRHSIFNRFMRWLTGK